MYVSHVRYFSSHVEFYVIECDMYGFNPHVGKKSKWDVNQWNVLKCDFFLFLCEQFSFLWKNESWICWINMWRSSFFYGIYQPHFFFHAWENYPHLNNENVNFFHVTFFILLHVKIRFTCDSNRWRMFLGTGGTFKMAPVGCGAAPEHKKGQFTTFYSTGRALNHVLSTIWAHERALLQCFFKHGTVFCQ